MATLLASLVVELVANSAAFDRGLRQARGGLKQFERDAQQTSAALQNAFTNPVSAIGALRGVLAGPAGIVAAIGATGAAAVGLASRLGGTIERLDNLARQTGLSVGALQAFEHAATQAGEAPESLVRGFGRINEAVAEILKGNRDAGKSFQAIGVDLVGLVSSGANTEQMLDAVAKALAGIKDPTRQAAAAQDLFGTKGKAMLTVLLEVADKGVGGYVEALRKAGIVTSEATNQMARLVDQLEDKVHAEFTKIGNVAQTSAAAMVLAFTGGFSTLQQLAQETGRAMSASLNVGALGGTAREQFLALAKALEEGRIDPKDASRTLEQLRAQMTREGQPAAGRRVQFIGPGAGVVLGVKEMAGELMDTMESIGTAIDEGFRLRAEIATEGAARALEDYDRTLKPILEDLEAWAPLLDDATRAWLEQNEEMNRSISIMQEWTGDVRRNWLDVGDDVIDTNLQIGTTFGRIQRPVLATGQGFRLLGAEADKAEREMRELESAFGDIERFEFGLEGRGVPLPKETVKRFSDDIKTQLRTGLADAIAEAALSGDVDAAIEHLGRHLGATIGDAFSRALAETMRTGVVSGDLVTSGGMVVGTTAGTAIGGGGGGASTGAVIGSVVGGVVGSYFGPIGTGVGAVAGGALGGYVGGLFDPSEQEQALHDFRSRLRDQTSAAFGEGVKEAVETGDVDGAFEHVADNLKNIIQNAVITAFVETAVIKGAMGPLIDAISDAMEQGLGPTAFMAHIMPGLEQFRGRLDMLRPLFGEMVGVFGDIGAILHGNADTTARWHDQLQDTAGAARDIRGELDAIPTDINVNVHREPGEGGLQHGGIVRSRGLYELAESGPEAVVPLDVEHLQHIGYGIAEAAGLDRQSGRDPELAAALRELAAALRGSGGARRRGAPV